MKLLSHSVLALILLFSLSTFAIDSSAAETTDIVVRAKARDAKFIGTSIGGAMVRIKNADTGEILAAGITVGGTGNTGKIMKDAKGRYDSIAEGAAAFKATLELDQPVFATIEVLAPYIHKQARVVAQTQTWIVPGKNIVGDGLVVEIPGMIVDVLAPQTHHYTTLSSAPFELKANVVMTCGCPLTSGGLWNGDEMEVSALIYAEGKLVDTVALAMQKEANTFRAEWTPKKPGSYQVMIYAYDPKTGNTGLDQTAFIVGKE